MTVAFYKDSQSSHDRYLYTANNPVNAVDPTGYQAFVEYSTADEEGAAVEPMGEEFASEAEKLIEEVNRLECHNCFYSKSTEFPANKTPFDANKLEKILKNLEKEGISAVRGAEAENILQSVGADALYDANGFLGNPRTLYLRDNASAPEVIEELIHVGQHRGLGWAPIENVAPLEIKAQVKLLNLADRFGWTPQEIAQLYEAIDYWILMGGL
jgi:hypothetical protein